MSNAKWYEKIYRRNLVDMHIEDWNEIFLSKLEPEKYVEMVKSAHIQSAMVYANSHVGYCYWPTRFGYMHSGLKGRDILEETIVLCHKEGINVVLYYSLIFNNWAYEHNPSWRILNADRKASREHGAKGFFMKGRYGLCCPNSREYREFAVKQVEELCRCYDFEGIFFDMTFWPAVCYCDSCKKRFAEETNGQIPDIVDWNDPVWLLFQDMREEWIMEFAGFMTGIVKKLKTEATVQHNFATAQFPWLLGITERSIKANDFISGDFYGGFFQQSFICKLYYSLTQNMPFEYMTSRCHPDLKDHTTMKSKDMLELHACLALAHNGAFLVIDAVDPSGVLNPKVYQTLSDVFGRTGNFEPYLGGELCQDVGIYFSFKSKVYLSDNGKKVTECREITDTSADLSYMDAPVGAARTLKENHIPFGVISRENLKNTSNYQIIVLPDVTMLDIEEADNLREFVKSGGSLYASGCTSARVLGDVFGLSFIGETREAITYITPTERGKFIMPDADVDSPLAAFGKQALVSTAAIEEVIAFVTLPYTDPEDSSRFASIHSNPPGIITGYPAAICRSYGSGKVVWVSTPLEVVERELHKKAFVHIVMELASKPFSFTAEAPAAIEITVFHQSENKRYLVNIINVQEQMPPIPVSGIIIRVRLGGRKAVRALLLPDEEALNFQVEEDYAEVLVPTLYIFHMLVLDYE